MDDGEFMDLVLQRFNRQIAGALSFFAGFFGFLAAYWFESKLGMACAAIVWFSSWWFWHQAEKRSAMIKAELARKGDEEISHPTH
jgi:hypothetical protein